MQDTILSILQKQQYFIGKTVAMTKWKRFFSKVRQNCI